MALEKHAAAEGGNSSGYLLGACLKQCMWSAHGGYDVSNHTTHSGSSPGCLQHCTACGDNSSSIGPLAAAISVGLVSMTAGLPSASGLQCDACATQHRR